MQGPTEEFREHVREIAEGVDSEDALTELLDEIEGEIRTDIRETARGEAADELAAVEGWASVASYPVARFSAPASPWPPFNRLAGWGTKAVRKLRSITNTLKGRLQGIARDLGAESFSIGVSFPWGIQISLTWERAGGP
jgi:hypothetical protein